MVQKSSNDAAHKAEVAIEVIKGRTQRGCFIKMSIQMVGGTIILFYMRYK
jgi:hypothetical protein